MTQRIVITGAAGGVGTLLRPRLARAGRILRLLDVAPIPGAGDGGGEGAAEGTDVETVQVSVTDLPAMREALTGADAVIHLGGLSAEGPWDKILDININGTRTVLEAARRAGVPRVIIASSSHAVGFYPRNGEQDSTAAQAAGRQEAPDYLFPRPDTYYGVSKVAGEALGSLYHDRYGLDVICVRIGGCFERPIAARQLATWLSPDDCARLMEALLAAPSPGFRVVWGVSDNTRRWFSLDEARALGYEPQDDAERFAAELEREGRHDPLDDIYLGGAFCSPDLDASLDD